uniref:ArsR/SmtB family transcription factor n=1 Tax=Kineosporia sp. R_H_3 TaxID=1961848 RepID=UPI000B4B3F70
MADALRAVDPATGGPPDPAGPVLDALGDPTRRRLLGLLRDGERTVADLTAALPVTQSAVSQHLRVLRDAGLVSDRPDGRRRYYRVERDGLSAVRAYVDAFWDDVLDAFAAYAAAPGSPDAPDSPDSPD